MSRSLSREEPAREEKADASTTLEGLSRSSGSEKRQVLSPEAESTNDFGDNRRARILLRDREYRVRPSEGKALNDLGVFRLIREDDLARGVYAGNADLLRADLRSLRKQGLVRSITFQGLRGGASRVYTLTGEGHELVTASRSNGPQFYYWGVVKPAEADHDSLLYRAYLHERGRIRAAGGSIKRVVLDTELKRAHYSRTNKPGGSYAKLHAESARELHLPVVDGHVTFPDFRIEYEDERGDLARSDVEVATGNYREQHMAAKAAAGFHVYAAGGASGGLRVQSGGRLKGQAFPQETRTVLLL